MKNGMDDFPSLEGICEFGRFGDKDCCICERHLKCPKEELVFIKKVLGENHRYCIGFELSKAIQKNLLNNFWVIIVKSFKD